jgi:hypothetical protein
MFALKENADFPTCQRRRQRGEPDDPVESNWLADACVVGQ